MNWSLVIILLALLAFLALFIQAVLSIRKDVIKDWGTLDYLKKRANEVSTKEEIEEFHIEFVEKANKIKNSLIRPHLDRIDGYLRGLYKQYEK